MDKKTLTIILSSFMICFYIAIIVYIFLVVLPVTNLANFETAIASESISFILLAYLVLSNILSNKIKTGYLVPLVVVTVVYMFVLNILNLMLVVTLPHFLFVLINFVLLFLYCLVSFPMYLIGKK